jgi:glucose-1-phosphate cytidylyltransferase
MKVVILAGGLGTRLAEETQVKPKPMVEIGGRPILWHIMKMYNHYGHSEFMPALCYKGEVIKEYFLNYAHLSKDFSIELKSRKIENVTQVQEDWKVHLIDTGRDSMTGGRLFRLKEHLKGEETFMLTYGDGLCDVNISKLLEFHKSHKKIATVTAVRPPARFGALEINEGKVTDFHEKPQVGEGWINGGFFVFNKEVFNYLKDESTILEKEPLEKIAQAGELMAYQHNGFWQCMDTIRDRDALEKMWSTNEAPWKVWK